MNYCDYIRAAMERTENPMAQSFLRVLYEHGGCHEADDGVSTQDSGGHGPGVPPQPPVTDPKNT